jgi:hypothetical protein
MGNCAGDDEFFKHFEFLVEELLRVTVPGRLISFHCMNLPSTIQHNGYIGIRDFRGDLIRIFQSKGWIYHSEVCIWKDPVIAMQRTKAIGLLHKQVCKDSSLSRQGIPDYLVTMRKPGKNPDPIEGEFHYFVGENPPKLSGNKTTDSINIWQRYASPVWMDINPSNTLQFRTAKESDQEKHICLARGSLVLTHKHGYKPIQEVEIGDLVLTHKGRWMPVIAKEKTSDCAEIVSVNATGVCDFSVTPTHKFWAKLSADRAKVKKESAKKAIANWVEAQKLTNGYVNIKLPPVEDSQYSKQDWWIVGRWLADGHIANGTAGRTSLHSSVGNHKMDHFLENAGDIAGTRHYPGDTCTQIRLKDPDYKLRNLLESCGKKAHEKRLPPSAFTLNQELAKSLLDGYLSGDGYFQPSRQRWYATSVSKELLLGLQMIILRAYNVTSTLHKGKPSRISEFQGRKINCKQEYVLSFQTHGNTFNFADEDGIWKRVKSVQDAGTAETWNLRVLEDASYTAEGCIVKNCPLQLDVIERGLQLWSLPGETVLDPFNGIGSTGYVALKTNRKYVGCELKESYFKLAVRNLDQAESDTLQPNLLDMMGYVR